MRDQLCFHLKELLQGVVTNHDVQRFVGTLVHLDKRTMVAKTKELSYVLKQFLIGSYNEPIGNLNHWKIHQLDSPQLVPFYDSIVKVHYRFDESILNTVTKLPQTDPRTIKILSGMLKLGTVVTYDEPSQTERAEIYKTITKPFSGQPDFLKEMGDHIPEIMDLIMSGRWKDSIGHFYDPIVSTFGNPDKSSFAIDSSGHTSVCKRNELLAYNLNYVLRSPSIRGLYDTDPDRFITCAFTGVETQGSRIDWTKYPILPRDIALSRIISIPEPNGKFRTVCLPHLILNCLSYDMGLRLKAINSHWEVQGVDSHKETLEKLHTKLVDSLKNKPEHQLTFCCTDLKSFTDRFPYKGIQDEILNYLVNTKYLSAFDKQLMDVICNSPCEFGNSRVNYGVGTPQGTQPSFPLGSLANGVALYYSYYRAKGRYCKKNDLPGKIIGDDIVIWDEEVAWFYQDTIEKLGVEISIQKSLRSKRVIEMCSKIIHPSGIYDQKRLDKLPISTVSQYVDQYPYYGDSLKEFLLNREEDHRLILSIPRPYGLGRSLISEEDWNKFKQNLPPIPLTDPTLIEKIFMVRFLLGKLSIFMNRRRNLVADIMEKQDRMELIPPMTMGMVSRDIAEYTQNIPWVTSLIEETQKLYDEFTESQDAEALDFLSAQLLERYTLLRQFQCLGLPVGRDPKQTDLLRERFSGLKPVETIPKIVSQPSERPPLLDEILDIPFTPISFER